MRKIPLCLTGFSVLAVYLVASGALGLVSDGSFLECLERPLLGLSPMGAGVLAAAALAFAAGILAVSPNGEMGPSLSWSHLLQAAFVVNVLVVAGIAGVLFLGHFQPRQPQTVGVLFFAGIAEVA